VLGARARITNPRARLIQSNHFVPNLTYSIANTLWTFAGSNDVEFIEFYNPDGRLFSDDGRTLSAAPGSRIFCSAAGDQFAAAVDILSKDPSSRRAMIQLFLPQDCVNRARDASCIGSLQLLIREGSLHSIVNMRSQEAVRIFAYDAFLLSMLHEAAAKELNVRLGSYTVFFGSLHYYADEERLVDAILRDDAPRTAAMPEMESPLSRVRDVLIAAEKTIRQRLTENIQATIELQEFGLDSYWNTLFTILIFGTRQSRGGYEQLPGMDAIPLPYRTVLRESGGSSRRTIARRRH
jgi:thymidylate synthase